jgi:hypothetical protein
MSLVSQTGCLCKIGQPSSKNGREIKEAAFRFQVIESRPLFDDVDIFA